MADNKDTTPDTADGATEANRSSDAPGGGAVDRDDAIDDSSTAQTEQLSGSGFANASGSDPSAAAPERAWSAAPAATTEYAAPAASAFTASAPAASTGRQGRVRRLLIPGIALVAGLAIGLGGGALLGSAFDGPRGLDRAAFVGDSDGDRPDGAARGDGPADGGPRGDGPGSDGPGSDGPGSDGPGSDGPGSDGPGSDGPRGDGPAAGPGAGHRDGPNHDGDGPRRESDDTDDTTDDSETTDTTDDNDTTDEETE